jgi:hypothetical protein
MRTKFSSFGPGVLLIVSICTLSVLPQGTGKAYSSGENPRPSTAAPQFPSPVTFDDIASTAGVAFRNSASPTSLKYLPETMGAGVALIDFDNDGLLDLFFTNGAPLTESMAKNAIPEKSGPEFWDRLYRQSEPGKFVDVTEKAGIKGLGYSFGTAVGDFDKDGFDDLLVTRYGGATLYRNKKDGTFADATEKSGIKVDGWATSAGWLDYNRDGRLDLFVARYVVWDFEKGAIFCGDSRPGYRAYCHPDNFVATTSLLFKQKPDGTFEDVSDSSGISSTKSKGLGVAFGDLDNDGWTDIFVANDNAEQQLFQNKRDGTFEDVALPSGTAFDEKGRRFSGMGIDIADYDGDGQQDIIITALSNETYPLYRNMGDWVFDYVTQASGIAQISILGSGWGIKFADVDNDGRRDVFVAQGHVLDTIEKTSSYLKYKQTPLLIRNTEKEFRNISLASGSAFQQNLSARGLASGDIDNDGNIDFVISQIDGSPLILRNNGSNNRWLGVVLKGKTSARHGEGARVTVTDDSGKKQIFDAGNSGSYLSSNDPRILVGLGNKTAVKIEIVWPGGKTQIIENPQMNTYIAADEEQ